MVKPLMLMSVIVLTLAACGGGFRASDTRDAPRDRGNGSGGGGSVSQDLYPGETPEMRRLVNRYAEVHGIPRALLHAVIQRESDYRADARNGPYWGLMQILPETARTMGFRGQPRDLLDPEVNLEYAGRYLRGAWLVSDGDIDEAVMWYARGYYYEARNRCMLRETGLRDTEVRRYCG